MTRFHELDALRAVAMSLGVVLHSLLFLMPDPDGLWPVQEAWATVTPTETNPYVHLYLLIHGFRMPVFFLLSGFFTAMLWQRRGLRPLAEHRLKRIALPLALGALTVIPVTAWLASAFDPQNFGEFNPLFWPIAWLSGFAHLWFLWQLLLLLGVFVIFVRLGIKFTSPAWRLLIPLSVLAMFVMTENTIGPDTSQTPLPHWTVLGFYAIFFFFGAFFYQRGVEMRHWWALALIPALAVAYPGALLFLTDETNGYSEPQSARWAATSAFQAAYAWLMCFGAMGLFRSIAEQERSWVRYMSDSSYWLYLWHLPLVLVMQWLLLNAGMNVHLEFLLVFTSMVVILLAVYHLGVRYTWIGTMLNGKRYRVRPQPPSSPAGASVDPSS